MELDRIVNLSEGVAPSARLQNGTGEFPRIRLLNDRAHGLRNEVVAASI